MIVRCRNLALVLLLSSALIARAQTNIARAQTNIDVAKPNPVQPAPRQLKPHDLDEMGPWPPDKDYLNTAGLLNKDYLTATWQTVPRPSLSPTPNPRPKRKFKDLSGRWERSICSNCY